MLPFKFPEAPVSAVSYKDNDVISSGWSLLRAKASLGSLLARKGHGLAQDLSVLREGSASLARLTGPPQARFCLGLSKLKGRKHRPIHQQRPKSLAPSYTERQLPNGSSSREAATPISAPLSNRN